MCLTQEEGFQFERRYREGGRVCDLWRTNGRPTGYQGQLGSTAVRRRASACDAVPNSDGTRNGAGLDHGCESVDAGKIAVDEMWRSSGRAQGLLCFMGKVRISYISCRYRMPGDVGSPPRFGSVCNEYTRKNGSIETLPSLTSGSCLRASS